MAVDGSPLPRLVRTGLLTGISDFLFACVLSIYFYHSTFQRLWQGVASVPLGKEMLDGGTRTTLIGIGIHFCVAFTWSAVFIFLVMRSEWVRRVLVSPFGVGKVATVYGPFIWMVMSLVLIPLMVHRTPSITARWVIQGIGHIFFVALPLVWSASLELRKGTR